MKAILPFSQFWGWGMRATRVELQSRDALSEVDRSSSLRVLLELGQLSEYCAQP